MARLHVATDITERRRNEELYRQQQEKLALTARLVAVGEMATTLAHELNQPLAAIANYNTGCARRLRAGDWEAAELVEAMEKGAAQAERASSVIQRLREFVARRQPTLVACDINEVVDGVKATIEAEADKHSVHLVLALSHRIPYVRADQTLMEQVIINLARNAIDAMQDTPLEERELRISSRNGSEGTVEVEVADHGQGIDAGLEAKLFSPFFSTKPDGMGLGLHISRSIVEAHGGHLWITRTGERGMCFHFSLLSVYA
jgi:C4-dicarboxylate-specific signal transduction histidine kinase